MELGESVAALLALVLLPVLGVILSNRRFKRWETEKRECFDAALKSLHIDHYEVVVERVIPPIQNTTPQVFRIFHDRNGRYFLYLKVEGTPRVIKPLTKERALLAAEKSGYGRP